MREAFDSWLKHQARGSSRRQPSDALRFAIEFGRALLEQGPPASRAPAIRDLGQGFAAVRELRSIVDGAVGMWPGDAVLRLEERLETRLLAATLPVRSSA